MIPLSLSRSSESRTCILESDVTLPQGVRLSRTLLYQKFFYSQRKTCVYKKSFALIIQKHPRNPEEAASPPKWCEHPWLRTIALGEVTK